MKWQKTILIATSSASRHVGTHVPSSVTLYGGVFNWAFLKGDLPLIAPHLELIFRRASPAQELPWCIFLCLFSSVQFSHSVMSNSLWPHGLQQAGLPCLSPILGAYSTRVNWVGDAIQPSHPLSPSPPTFNLSQHQGLFQQVCSSHQVAKLSVSPSASVFPMNIQDWFPLGWTGWISLQSKGLSRVFSNTTVQKHHFFAAQLSL